MLLSLAALVVVGLPPDVPLAAFLRVPPKEERAPTKWSWPKDDEFAGVWSKRGGVKSVRVVEADFGDGDGAKSRVLIGVASDGAFIADSRGEGRHSSYLPDEWSAPLRTATVGTTLEQTYEGKRYATLQVVRVVDGAAVTDSAWVPFTFATTLLRHDGDLYDKDPSGDAPDATASDEEKLKAFRAYRPVGRCSMDRAPQMAAADYRDLCQKMGRIGCFLQLQTRLMADSFDRVAWSSWGEAVAGTDAKALVDAGVDVPRFLVGVGLILDDDNLRPGGINTWRLARSIAESGRRTELREKALSLVEDESLDELNRVRFAQVVAFLDGQLSKKSRDDEGPSQVWTGLQGKKVPRWIADQMKG